MLQSNPHILSTYLLLSYAAHFISIGCSISLILGLKIIGIIIFSGGRILYHNAGNKKHEFTIADVLCDYGGETHLCKGIFSQYAINKDNNNL